MAHSANTIGGQTQLDPAVVKAIDTAVHEAVRGDSGLEVRTGLELRLGRKLSRLEYQQLKQQLAGSRERPPLDRAGLLAEVHRAMDPDLSGHIEASELMLLGQARRQLGHKTGEWTEEMNQRLMDRLDVDCNGTISQSEFVSYFDRTLPQPEPEFRRVVEQFMQVAALCRGSRNDTTPPEPAASVPTAPATGSVSTATRASASAQPVVGLAAAGPSPVAAPRDVAARAAIEAEVRGADSRDLAHQLRATVQAKLGRTLDSQEHRYLKQRLDEHQAGLMLSPRTAALRARSTAAAKQAVSPGRSSSPQRERSERLRAVFLSFNQSAVGLADSVITTEELLELGKARRALKQKSTPWGQKQADKMLAQMDSGGDGTVSELEFIKYFMESKRFNQLPEHEFDSTIKQFMLVADRCRAHKQSPTSGQDGAGDLSPRMPKLLNSRPAGQEVLSVGKRRSETIVVEAQRVSPDRTRHRRRNESEVVDGMACHPSDEELAAQLAALQQENAALRQTIAANEHAVAERQSALDRIQGQAQQASERDMAARNRLESLLQDRETELRALAASLAEAEQAAAEGCGSSLGETEEAASAALDASQLQLAALQQENSTIRQTVAELKTAAAQAQDALASASQKQEDGSARIRELEQRLELRENRIGELEAELEHLKSLQGIQELEAELKHKEELRAAKLQFEATQEASSAESAALRAELEVLKQSSDLVSTKLEELTKDAQLVGSAHKETQAQLIAQCEAEAGKRQKLEQDLLAKQTELDGALHELSDVQSLYPVQIEHLKEAIANLQRDSLEKIQQHKATIDRLQTELEALRRDIPGDAAKAVRDAKEEAALAVQAEEECEDLLFEKNLQLIAFRKTCTGLVQAGLSPPKSVTPEETDSIELRSQLEDAKEETQRAVEAEQSARKEAAMAIQAEEECEDLLFEKNLQLLAFRATCSEIRIGNENYSI